ncbi:MAG: hypothetical protein GKR93_16825 [Gammaproteobacteria bacterium]|nr:hypothetical protein [Gammaproteobacteria bacterium]
MSKTDNLIIRKSLRPRPVRPADSECCQRGCEPCVFDYYQRAMERWQQELAILEKKPV